MNIKDRILTADFAELLRLRDSVAISDAKYQEKKRYIEMIDRRLRPKESNCLVEHGDSHEFADELVDGGI